MFACVCACVYVSELQAAWTPLHFACASGKLDVVLLLLELTSERLPFPTWLLTSRDGHSETPVDLARRLGFADVVTALEKWAAGRVS